MGAELLGASPELLEIFANAYTAGGYADMAGRACNQIVREALHVLYIVRKCLSLAASKFRNRIFSLYRIIPSKANRCHDAIRVLETLINRAKIAGNGALAIAADIIEETGNLSSSINMEMDISEKVSSVIAATKLAKHKMKLVNKAMYLVLKGTEECLLVADFQTTREGDSNSGSWMDTAKGFLTPLTVGLVLSGCIYRYMDKIKNPVYYSFLGVKIPPKILIPGSIIACFVLHAIHSSLEDDEQYERLARDKKLDKVRRFLNTYGDRFSFPDNRIPSFEEAKKQILANRSLK